MPSYRMAQMNELLRREVTNALLRVFDVPRDCVLTIEEVRTSRDLSQAKVAVSVFPFHRREAVVRSLQVMQGDIQRLIAQRIKTKKVPKILFYADEREERADTVQRLLDAPPFPPRRFDGVQRKQGRGGTSARTSVR